MNKQEIFDTTWNGLKSQGFMKCKDINFQCCYRGITSGQKCAAGWILPDEAYDQAFNNRYIDDVPWFVENFDADHLKFIKRLQKAHDKSAGVKSMKRLLIEAAESENLILPEDNDQISKT